ncbi:MAG: TrkA C-terminal domain-containing protein [Halovenus sp.]
MSALASAVAAIFDNPLIAAAVRIVGLALLAAGVTAAASFFYRVRAHTTLPEGATVILGLGAVALYLNTRLIFIQFVGDAGDPLTFDEAVVNVAVFLTAGIASYAGRYAGDTVGSSDRITWGRLQPDLSPIVRAAGRFITVTLPEEIEDIDGYDPVAERTKTALAGRKLDFPRGLTVTELQSQLAARLTQDHDVGYVDVDLTADGTVEYIAVGQRVAGIGPTLPPGAAAVAVRADPPFSATAGDTVQLWHSDEEGERPLGTAELRGSAGSVVTVATDEQVATSVDPTADYRLMTLPADSHPDREFAAMLRHGDETMSIVEVAAGSSLVGLSVGALDLTIIAVRTPEGEVETIPTRSRVIRSGDHLFAVGRPESLRKLDSMKGAQLVDGNENLEAAVFGSSPSRWC